jgi:hypothetical protein
MNTSTSSSMTERRRFIFGLVSILSSIVIAILITTGVAEPHPNFRFAYFICVAVGVFGFVQLIMAVVGKRQS